MAAVTHRDTFATTSSSSPSDTYTGNSFTPALNDLLVVFAVVSDSVLGSPTMTDSQSLGFSLVAGGAYEPRFATNAHRMYAFISNGLAVASAMTVTLNVTGDSATGGILLAAGVSGMSRTGLDAFLQGASQENRAAGTPAPAFAASALTGNVTLGCVAQAALTAMTPPSGWTEQADTNYSTPSIAAEYVSRNSGFTGTTVTWGSATGGNFASLILELDTTVPSSGGGGGGARNLLLFGVG